MTARYGRGKVLTDSLNGVTFGEKPDCHTALLFRN